MQYGGKFALLTSYKCNNGSVSCEITNIGDCTKIDDGDGNCRLKFLTSG